MFEERPIEQIINEIETGLLEAAKLAGNRVQYLSHFMNLALAIAMRRGEICSLEWQDLDLKGQRISFYSD